MTEEQIEKFAYEYAEKVIKHKMAVHRCMTFRKRKAIQVIMLVNYILCNKYFNQQRYCFNKRYKKHERYI